MGFPDDTCPEDDTSYSTFAPKYVCRKWRWIFINVLYEMLTKLRNLKSPLEDFKIQQSEQVRIEDMACSPVLLKFFADVGTF
jgi:hypothetical protein